MTVFDALDRRLPRQMPLDRNPVLNGIADLRSAIQRANKARFQFELVCNPLALPASEARFRQLKAAYLETKNQVRTALGALGLGPFEINQLGEVLS